MKQQHSTTRPADTAPTVCTRPQVRALIAPARQEIVDVLGPAGPCSVATLAALVGRPADALYHHLRRLVRVGLITQIERRKVGRHVYAVYDLCIRPLRMSYEPPVRPGDIAAVVGAAQRLAWRDFRRALASGRGVTQGPARTVWGAREKGWVTPRRLARINRLLAELIATVRGGAPAEGAMPISVSFILAPAPPTRRPKSNPTSRPRDSRADASSTQRKPDHKTDAPRTVD